MQTRCADRGDLRGGELPRIMFLTGGVSQYTVQTRAHLRKGQLEDSACPRPDPPIRSRSIREDESMQCLGPHRLEGSLLTTRLVQSSKFQL